MARSQDSRKPLRSQRGPKRTGDIGTILPGDDVEVARDIQRIWWELRRRRATITQDGPWIPYGTAGVDGVDAFLTELSPAFANGWTHSDPTFANVGPFSFMKTLNGHIHLRGGITDGADNTDIGEPLPVGYRPPVEQPCQIRTRSGKTCNVTVFPSGLIRYEGLAP